MVSLRNEFFEVLINPKTGTLQSIHDFQSRGNLLSQQLAFKLPSQRQAAGEAWRDPVETAVYSVMAADEVQVTAATEVFGEVTTRGQLLGPDGRSLAGFTQWYRLWRGGRIVEVEIELDPREEPRADPWSSYYCARFAWADEGADLYRTINDARYKSESGRFESPQLIELDNGERRVAILTAGLPFHRRHGLRMLDSLLITRGETQRRFRLGIGVQLPHAIHAAATFQHPEMLTWQDVAPSQDARSAWLFHLDNRNVLPTAWSPLVEDGDVRGFRVRLLETAGRAARLRLASFRELGTARQVDFRGQGLGDCRLEEGSICLQLTAHEWAEIEARWATGEEASAAQVAAREPPSSPPSEPPVVTSDGPAGAGKSTVARALAKRLDWHFLDTGAMYRCVALAALRRRTNWEDPTELEGLVDSLAIVFDGGRVLLDEEDVTHSIRQPEVTEIIHRVADPPGVRERLIALQRRAAAAGPTVTEGRDQGTLAFPAASCKIFLTASAEERARRRQGELAASGQQVSFEEVLSQQRDRDRRDQEREVGRLQRADDAIELVTDGMSQQEVVERLVSIVCEATGWQDAQQRS